MGILDKRIHELTPLDIELFREAASALARCGERLEHALARLRQSENLLEDFFLHGQEEEGTAGSGSCGKRESGKAACRPTLSVAIEQYRWAWRKAKLARYAYLVQREALGLRTHRFVDRIFPLPPYRRIPG